MSGEVTSATRKTRFHINRFDAFAAFNVSVLLGSTLYAYTTSELEFGLYAAAILGVGGLVWRFLRKFEYPVWLLILLQLSIVVHFAGGFLFFDTGEGRLSLYWNYVLGMRYDKWAHMFNSAVGALAMAHVFYKAGLRLSPMRPFVLIMVVGGLGAGVEILEYVAVRVIPRTGVGEYANTVEDMIMNFIGAAIGVAVVYGFERFRRNHRGQNTEAG